MYKYLKCAYYIVIVMDTKKRDNSDKRSAEAIKLSRDIEKLKGVSSEDDARQILREIYEFSKSDNDSALDVIARIRDEDFEDSKAGKIVINQIISAKLNVARNESAKPSTLNTLAVGSVRNGIDDMIDTIMQCEIIENSNAPLLTINYLAENSIYSNVRELAVEEGKSRSEAVTFMLRV